MPRDGDKAKQTVDHFKNMKAQLIIAAIQHGRSPAVNESRQSAFDHDRRAEAVAIDYLHVRIESQPWPWWH